MYGDDSRNRIIESINHREPDVLPIDFGSMGSTGISVIAYNRLKSYLQISNIKTRLYDIGQQLAAPELDIIKRFGGDVINIKNPFFSCENNDVQWKD